MRTPFQLPDPCRAIIRERLWTPAKVRALLAEFIHEQGLDDALLVSLRQTAADQRDAFRAHTKHVETPPAK